MLRSKKKIARELLKDYKYKVSLSRIRHSTEGELLTIKNKKKIEKIMREAATRIQCWWRDEIKPKFDTNRP